MNAQALETFKVGLAQTIHWCALRADPSKPATSLRTPQLRPRLLEESRSSAAETVSRAREAAGGLEIRMSVIPDDLAGGRLLAYFPDLDLSDGAAELHTDGFFDVNNVPSWDTWVGYCLEAPSAGRYDTEYLVAWVPHDLVSLAGEGIECNPEECIRWLADTNVEMAEALRTVGLLK